MNEHNGIEQGAIDDLLRCFAADRDCRREPYETLLRRPVPRGWTREKYGPWGFAYVSGKSGDENTITVIETIGTPGARGAEEDGVWMHVSCSYPDRLPSWETLGMVKRLLMGHDSTALVILPPAREYVNIHPNCLHLWHRLDAPSAPAFALEVAPGKYSI